MYSPSIEKKEKCYFHTHPHTKPVCEQDYVTVLCKQGVHKDKKLQQIGII